MGERASIWRDRDVVLVLGGGVVNDIGDWMLEIALPVYVYLETGSGLATAGVYIIDLLVGLLLGPYGGSLADRWPLRATLVATNVAQAVTLLPLLLVSGDRIWPIYVVTALQAVIQQVNNPASFALLPRLVDGDQLVQVNALRSSGWSLARLIGSAAGGIAVATGGVGAVLVIDAITFLIVAAAMSRISDRANRLAAPSDDEPGGEDAQDDGDGAARDTSVRAGIRVVRSRPAVQALVLIESIARMAFAAFPVIFIVFVADELMGGGTEIGMIRASSAFGGMIAAIVVARYAKRFHPAALMTVGYLSFCLIGYGFVNAPSFTTALWVYLVLFALTGFPNVTAMVGLTSTAQLLCPPAMLGRLAGLMSATGAVGAGLGAIGAGVLLEVVSARALFNIQTTLIGIGGLIAYFQVWRRVRDHPR